MIGLFWPFSPDFYSGLDSGLAVLLSKPAVVVRSLLLQRIGLLDCKNSLAVGRVDLFQTQSDQTIMQLREPDLTAVLRDDPVCTPSNEC